MSIPRHATGPKVGKGLGVILEHGFGDSKPKPNVLGTPPEEHSSRRPSVLRLDRTTMLLHESLSVLVVAGGALILLGLWDWPRKRSGPITRTFQEPKERAERMTSV